MRAPIPGDPRDLHQTAGVLSRAADEMASRERALRRGTSVATAGWLGAAANAFGAAVGEHAGRLADARRGLGSLGSAVRGYAAAVENLQSQSSRLEARRGALHEELRAAMRQRAASAVVGSGTSPEGAAEQIARQIRRLDDEADGLRDEASAARRRLTASLDDLAPRRPLPRSDPRPHALGPSARSDLTAGGASAVVRTVWSHGIPNVPAQPSTGPMHCGPARRVITVPGGPVTTGPVGRIGEDGGSPPWHRMRTGPVGRIGEDGGSPPWHRMRTGPVSPVLVDPTRHMTTGPVRRMP